MAAGRQEEPGSSEESEAEHSDGGALEEGTRVCH